MTHRTRRGGWTAAEYVEIVVLPMVRRFLAERGDQPLAYATCILTHHIIDRLSTKEYKRDRVIAELNDLCSLPLEVVGAMCNGTKHPSPSPRFNPGDERYAPQFAFGVEGAGWDEGRFGADGLRLDVEGRTFFIDEAVQAVLLCMKSLFPAKFASIDLAWLDASEHRNHAWEWDKWKARTGSTAPS